MTEQQLRERFEAWAAPLLYEVGHKGPAGQYLGAATAIAWEAWQAAAKNIDTASPSPASPKETRRLFALGNYLAWETDPNFNEYVTATLHDVADAFNSMLAALATPQPSPTGPTQVEPGSAERYAEQERKARSVAPTGPREGEPTADILDYVRTIYGYLESTAPPGVAIEAFRLPPNPTRTQIALFNAATSDAHGECLGLARQDRKAESGNGSAVAETATPSLPLQEPVAWRADVSSPVVRGGKSVWRAGELFSFEPKGANVRNVVPLYAAPSLPAVLTDARLWSFLRSVMSHAASIEAEHMGHGYEVRSAHLDAAASDYVDKLRALATSATPVLP